MPVKPGSRAIVSLVLWAAIAYFFVLVLRRVDWHAVASHRLDASAALAVLIAGTANRFVLPLIWGIVLSSLEGRRIPTRIILWPYAESWMARYLPGKVAFIGTRVLAADKYGYSRVNAVISGGVEVVLHVVFLTTLSVILLSLGLESELPFNIVPVVAAAVALAVLISPPVLRRVVGLYLHVQKKTDASVSHLSWRAVFGCAAALSLMYCVQSMYSILLAESLGLAASTQPLLFLGAIFLSSIAGIVAFFSPGGIGVRELVFVQVLQPWFAREDLVSFVIFWRLAETLMDLLFAALARLIRSDY